MDRLAFSLVCLFIFTVPWQNMVVVSGFGSISRVIGPVVLLIALLSTLYFQKIRLHKIFILLLVYGFWLSLTYFWSQSPDSSLITIETYAQILLMVWLVFQYARQPQTIRYYMLAYVLGACVTIVATVNAYMQGLQVVYQRYAATGFDANDLAVILAFAIPMAWYLSLYTHQPMYKWLLRAFPAVAVPVIVLTGSRTGFLVALSAMSYILFTFSRITFGDRVAVVLFGILLFFVGSYWLPEENVRRILSIGSALTEGDMNTRLRIWRAGLATMGNTSAWGFSSLWGTGVGTFQLLVEPYLGRMMSAHNAFLSILLEQGIIGLLVFITIYSSMFIYAFKARGDTRALWLVLLSAWGIAAFSLNIEWRKETWLLFAFVISHIATLQNEPQYRDRVQENGQCKSVGHGNSLTSYM